MHISITITIFFTFIILLEIYYTIIRIANKIDDEIHKKKRNNHVGVPEIDENFIF